jgi:ribosomal protein S18 acetylase RimI-like enzyme
LFPVFNYTLKITNNNKDIPAIIRLYTETFSKGVSAQFIDSVELNLYIVKILEKGFAIQFFDNYNKLIACLLYATLAVDSLCPPVITQRFEPDKCAYIAEIMVDEECRGEGLGKALITHFFETVDAQKYNDVFIRVWDENIPAVQLYLKMGFEVVANIEQTKITLNGDSEFSMNKLYLHKQL